MTTKTAAIRYARALVDVAVREKSDLRRIEDDLSSFIELLAGHPALKKILLNPAVPVPRKQAAVKALTARLGVTPIAQKLLVLLAERDRLVLLDELLASYRDRLLALEDVVRAEVTTAVPLGSDRMQAIERGLSQATGRRVTLAAKVDPAIIGGVVARLGSTVYDASVTTQLEKMKQRLAESV